MWLADEGAGELWTKVAHGITEIRIPIASGLAGACFLTNKTMIVNDMQADLRFNRTIDASSGYESRSAICVPLQVADATIGVLQFLNKPEGFTEQDAEVLRLMSLYSASAIQSERLRQMTESARLLRRELDVAAAVQQRLLPQRRSNLGGLEYLGFCRPASSVGGDFYDLLELEDGSLGITLGDGRREGLSRCRADGQHPHPPPSSTDARQLGSFPHTHGAKQNGVPQFRRRALRNTLLRCHQS